MSRDFAWQRPPTAESVSRLVNFTDAVAGIAVTLLVLPMLDIEPPTDGESLWSVMGANSGIFLAFAISFAITLSFWRKHHRMLDGLQSFTPQLVWLNGFWLAALVFLQFPTEMLGQAGPEGGIMALYAATMAIISFLGIGMSLYLRGKPDLIPPERLVPVVQLKWALVSAVYVALLALLGLFAPQAALWGLIGLAPLGWLQSWSMGRQPRDKESPAAT